MMSVIVDIADMVISLLSAYAVKLWLPLINRNQNKAYLMEGQELPWVN